jgi:hypothetical protein
MCGDTGGGKQMHQADNEEKGTTCVCAWAW